MQAQSPEPMPRPPDRAGAAPPSASEAAPARHGAGPPLVRDLAVHVPLGIGAVAGYSLILGAVMVAATGLGVPRNWLWIIVAATAFLSVELFQSRAVGRLRARIRRLERDPLDDVELIQAALRTATLQNLSAQRTDALCVLATAIARRTGGNRAYRLADRPGELPPLGEPIDVPFEPIALNARSARYRELAGEPESAWTRLREGLDAALRALTRSRSLRRVLLAGMALGLVVFAVALVRAVADLLRGVTPELLVAIAVGGAVGLVFALRNLARPRDWLAAPRCIVVRQSRWTAAHWRLHGFRRDESVLLHWLDQGLLIVADATSAFALPLSPRGATLALRAWLSPCPAPPLERFSDLR